MALKLKFNEPTEIMLLRPDPKVYTNEGRTSYMYSVQLADGSQDKAFLTAEASATLQQLRIQAMQPFTIVRRKTAEGREFFDLHTRANEARSVSHVPAPQPPAPMPMASAATLTGHTKASAVMGSALIAAIDAAKLAEQYAASKGIAVEFGPEDLRAIANTIYIQAWKDPLFADRVA